MLPSVPINAPVLERLRRRVNVLAKLRATSSDIPLGVLFLVIPLWLTFMMQPAEERPPVYRTALFLLPGATMALAGTLLLAIRNKYFVRITVVVLTLAFLVDALLSFNPIRWAISGACLYLVWRAGRQALVEVQIDSETG